MTAERITSISEMHPRDRGEKAYQLMDRIDEAVLSDPESTKTLARLYLQPRDIGRINLVINGTKYSIFSLIEWSVEGYGDSRVDRSLLIARSGENGAIILEVQSNYRQYREEKYFESGKIHWLDGSGDDQEAIDLLPKKFPEIFGVLSNVDNK